MPAWRITVATSRAWSGRMTVTTIPPAPSDPATPSPPTTSASTTTTLAPIRPPPAGDDDAAYFAWQDTWNANPEFQSEDIDFVSPASPKRRRRTMTIPERPRPCRSPPAGCSAWARERLRFGAEQVVTQT